MTTRILLIRHGQTDWNVQGRCQGMTDTSLSEVGKAQARALGRWLRGRIGVDLPTPEFVVASDLERARQTARIATEGLKIPPIQLDPAWREIAFGVWEGLTWDEIGIKYPEVEKQHRADPFRTRVPEGETQEEVLHRSKTALLRLIDEHPNSLGIVFSHGSLIRILISNLLGIDPLLSRHVRIFNCSTSEVRGKPGEEPRVIGYNDHCYLPSELY